MANERERETVELRPEARLGAALRAARERRGISLRALARRLYRSHSNLVEYERGHRLAPFDVVQAYETELGLASGTLLALQERARLEFSAERLSGDSGTLEQPMIPGTALVAHLRKRTNAQRKNEGRPAPAPPPGSPSPGSCVSTRPSDARGPDRQGFMLRQAPIGPLRRF